MKTILTTLSLLFFGSFAQAAGYGDAGCGLGAMVLGSQKGWTQVFAATLNGTSGNQTFGITSGTSNCTDGGAVAMDKQVPMFVEVNRFALAKEAARGGGDTVSGLAHLMGCDAKVLGQSLQQNYNAIFVDSKMEAGQIEQQIRAKAGTCGA